MRRALVPALALALVPLASLPAPAVAGPATPGVVTPTSGPAAFSFEVPEAMTAVLLEIRRVGSSAVVASTDLGDLAAGTTSATWDARTTSGTAVADGSYVATLRASDAATPLADESTVRVNLAAPKSAAAPAVSATSVFPWNDGYRDAITLTGVTPTTETPASAAVQVLNASGAVVWSAAGRTARWTGRSSVGAIVPAGTYRVRSRYVDADGLVGYSAPRAVTVSAKRLVTRKVTERISPKAFLYYPYV
ncbi:FlgD immunoglobulin-like domain containing protein, partial [Mumia sp.]|uniref:FlgD immunoglobulin-like domain containing protein n=1 Tax=Mumia sp. TaxID=1965300 RepID=UPI00262BC301